LSPTMTQASVNVFIQGLEALSEILAKAALHAEARKVDPAVLVGARLYPDMFPLSRQVQIAADFAKGTVARLAGREPPKWADDETTFDQLRDRIARTLAFVREIPTVDVDAGATRDITITMRGEPVTFAGPVYLFHFAMPNFWFHATTAYAILRHNGVEVGKRDFMGKF